MAASKKKNTSLSVRKESYEKAVHVLSHKLARLQKEVELLTGEKAKAEILQRQSSIEKDRKKIVNQKDALEAFHTELLRKERLIAQRSKSVQVRMKELNYTEKEVKENLSKINRQLVSAERKLEKTTRLGEQCEEKVSGYKAHLKNLTMELNHLLRIRKEMRQEVVNINAIDGLIKRISALLKTGELERAMKDYESLRVTYRTLDRDIKKKLYPKLIELHYSIKRDIE